MVIEKNTKGVILKLGTSKTPKYPDSSSGNTHNGLFSNKPVVGESFLMDCGISFFKTTFVVEIISETDNEIIFETNNSRYQLIINLLDVI